jgi:hypothetical protein
LKIPFNYSEHYTKKFVILTKEGTSPREQTTTNHKLQTTNYKTQSHITSNLLLQFSIPTYLSNLPQKLSSLRRKELHHESKQPQTQTHINSIILFQHSSPTSTHICHPDEGRNSTTRANNYKPQTQITSIILLQHSSTTSPQICHPDEGRNSSTRANNYKPQTQITSSIPLQPSPKIVILTKEETPPREQTKHKQQTTHNKPFKTKKLPT